MLQHISKKIAYSILVLAGVVVFVFILFQGLGDPSKLTMGQTGDAKTRENIRKELYLDLPKWKQFLLYLNDVSPVAIHSKEAIEKKQLNGFFIGNDTKIGIKLPYLRRSYQSKREVGSILMQALPGTVMLTMTAMAIAVMIGIPLGILAALKKHTWIDSGAIFSSIIGISTPSFFMGIIIAYLFGFVFTDYTGLQISGNWVDIDDVTGERLFQFKNLILPAITLGIRPLAIITQLTRSTMLDVMDQDYIRTAYAKGLNQRNIVWRHALKNALNPVITAITGWFAELLAGAFFVEYIFGWQGIGKITVDALEKLDYPVVMGSVLLTAVFFVMMNMITDVLYAVFDPRVKL